MINLWTVIKGLLVQEESDRSKELSLEVDSSSATNTRTTLKSAQSVDRLVNLPDADDTLVGKDTTDVLTNKSIGDSNTIAAQSDAFSVQDATDASKELDVDLSAAAASTKVTLASSQTVDRVLNLPDADDTLVGEAAVQVLTNKTINADVNTVSNLEDGNIKAAAAIDVAKLHDGSVSNAEFAFLDGVTSSIQSQIDGKEDALAGLTDNALLKADGVDGLQSSGVSVDDTNNVTGVNDLTVAGDLVVNGTTTSINSTVTEIQDANITINKNGNDASSEGSGVTVERVGVDGSLVYEDALASKFKIGAAGSEVEVADVSSAQALSNKDLKDVSNLLTGASVDSVVRETGNQQVVSIPDAVAANDVVLNNHSQTITNKIYDGGTASAENRVNVPQDTKVNLDALTRSESALVYANDEDKLYIDDGAVLLPVGSGGGSAAKLIGGGKVSWDTAQDTAVLQNAVGGGSFGGNAISTDTEFEAQSFSFATDIVIQSISIDMINGGSSTGTARMDIYSDVAGEPGVALATGTEVDLSTIPNVQALYNFPVDFTPVVSTTYWFVFIGTITSSNYNVFIKNPGAAAATGNRATTTNSGTSWTVEPSQDLEYQILGLSPFDVNFTASLFLEVAGLDYSANTIPVSASGFILNDDKDVAFVSPNTTNPGGDLVISTGVLTDVGASDIIIARRDGVNLLIGDTTLIQPGEPRELYDTNSGLFKDSPEAAHYTMTLSLGSGVFTDVTVASPLYDPNGNVGAGTYTFSNSGTFQVMGFRSGSINSSAFRSLDYRINGSGQRPVGMPGNGSTGVAIGFTFAIEVEAGDVLTFIPFQTTGSIENTFIDVSVNQISEVDTNILTNNKLDQQTVTARYKTNGGTTTSVLSPGVPTVIDFNELDFDTHNAVSGAWLFTAPRRGYYEVTPIVSITTNAGLSSMAMSIQKNGSPDTRINLTLNDVVISGSTIIYLDKDDTLNAAVTLSASGAIALQVADTSITVTSKPDFSLYGVVKNYEVVSSGSEVTAAFVPSAGQFGDLTSIELSAGTWSLSGRYGITSIAGAINVIYELLIGTVAGNDSTGLAQMVNFVRGARLPFTSCRKTIEVSNYIVTISEPTTYYLKNKADTVAGVSSDAYFLQARRLK